MTEAWLDGPVPRVPPLLQPVAHTLLQVRREVQILVASLPDDALWSRPNGVASAGFHLQHLRGVVDRLFTYARGEPLSDMQREALRIEGTDPSGTRTAASLSDDFGSQVDAALAQLAATDESSLLDFRGVGRAQLPSTVLGLLVHAAEHCSRHLGQLLVTVRVVVGKSD